MRTLLTAALVLSLGAAGLALSARAGKKAEEKKVDTRFFEMRTYHAAPGKMKALHARFRDHTCKIFKKHGMTIIGFWSPADPTEAEKTLVYILAYPSKEAREKSWQGFRNDPDWKKAKDESEKGGPLVQKVDSVFLNPTDYSPIQ
jgi:NIPSNAP